MISAMQTSIRIPNEGIIKLHGESGWITTSLSGALTTFRPAAPEGAEGEGEEEGGHTTAFTDANELLDGIAAAARAYLQSSEAAAAPAGVSSTVEAEAEADAALLAVAERVYRSIPVEVSLLDDALATPAVSDEDYLVDLWSPFYLAAMVRHAGAAAALLDFHGRFATSVIEALLRARARADDPSGTNAEGEERLVCATRANFGRCVLLLGRYEVPAAGAESEEELARLETVNAGLNDAEEALLQDQGEEFCLANVLDALRTFVEATVHALEVSREDLSFVLEQLRAFAARAQQQQQQQGKGASAPSLVVGASIGYDRCREGNISLLRRVHRATAGVLCPVFRGKRYCDTAPHSRRESRAASLPSTPRGSGGGGGGISPGDRPPFWFGCNPQEAQRTAFYAAWLAYRRRSLLSAAAQRSEAHASLSLAKPALVRYPPRGCIWCAHMYAVSRLLSKECTIEDFIDVVAEAEELPALGVSQDGIPGAVTCVLAGAVMVAALLRDAPAVVPAMTRKLEALLADVGGRPCVLRRYLLSRPLSHAARFAELWIAETTFAGEKKFRTRAEFLYFATIELVAAGAEEACARLPSPSPSSSSGAGAGAGGSAEERERAITAATIGWVRAWRDFFEGVYAKPSGQRKRGKSHSPDATDANQSRSGSSTAAAAEARKKQEEEEGGAIGAVVVCDEESELRDTLGTIRAVLDTLPQRLAEGKSPLPAVHAALFPATAASSGGEGTAAGGEAAVPSIDKEFQQAQAAFGRVAERQSTEVKLKFYGLFKQATGGDVTGGRPWMVDPVGRAKWDAWNACKGMSRVDAMRAYVSEYKALQAASTSSGEGNK